MKTATITSKKDERAEWIQRRRANHHRALETLAQQVNCDTPGLTLWRQLRRLENWLSAYSVQHCNGDSLDSRPAVRRLANGLPRANQDARKEDHAMSEFYIPSEHLELNPGTTSGHDIAIFRSGEEDAEPVVTIHQTDGEWPEIARLVLDALNGDVDKP